MSFHREPSRLFALIAILAITLIGCATDTSQGAPLEYRRSGGIVGFDDYLAIDAKGHAILTRRTGKFVLDLTSDELARLQALLRDAGFATIPENKAQFTCA